ncbi:MAG: hypothetical protein JW797_17655 [Bradymonadales bacterium]|nr:hypothetical protein [Bradymonadales bacterium]
MSDRSQQRRKVAWRISLTLAFTFTFTPNDVLAQGGPRDTTVPALSQADLPNPDAVHLADLDGDGEEEILSVFLAPGGSRGVFTVQDGDRLVTSPIYPVWGLETAELDGRPGDEIVLGVWSSLLRHPEPQPHRTVWVLRWTGHRIEEVWLGSAMARPLLDIGVADLDGDGRWELVALERTADRCVVTAYRFDGFGFVGLARLPADCIGLELCRPIPERERGDCVSTPSGSMHLRLVDGVLVGERRE